MDVHLAVSVALQDAGEATRSVELARGMRESCPPGWRIRCTFLSHGSRFETMVREAGFDVHQCRPAMEGRSVADDLHIEFPQPRQVIGSTELAHALIQGQREALESLRPDVVLHGFWPVGNLASRLLGLPRICFLPIPLHPDCVAGSLLQDVPDQVPLLSELPQPLRRALIRAIPGFVKRDLIGLPQQRLRDAAVRAGWQGRPPQSILDMLEADLTLVNDLPDFYEDMRLPEGLHVTGPLFAPASEHVELDPAIVEVLAPEHRATRVLCTMGSSGTRAAFLEAVRAVSRGGGGRWHAVIAASPAVCPIADARACAGERPGLVVTDRFLPAPAVNALADVVVCHGGQGTVQTAMASGTPLVGAAMQMEQQINLDHIERRGAGIRVPLRRWRSHEVASAIERVLRDPAYREAARRLQRSIAACDGRKAAAVCIWEHLTRHRVGRPA